MAYISDVDECEEDASRCENGRCVNTPGSFSCDCPSGFNLSSEYKCEGIVQGVNLDKIGELVGHFTSRKTAFMLIFQTRMSVQLVGTCVRTDDASTLPGRLAAIVHLGSICPANTSVKVLYKELTWTR